LQEANHEYLERAQETIERLGELGAEGDRRAEEAREAVSAGAGEVAALSSKVDEMLSTELDDAKRAALLDSADAIRESVDRVAEATAAQAGLGPTFESIDLLFDRLEALIDGAMDERPTLLAALELDPLGASNDDALVATIKQEVASLIAEVAPGAQTFGGGARSLVLLQGDDLDAATQRVERMRQTLAATTFRLGDKAVQATVTCAVAELTSGVGRGAVESQFAQVMAEADQGGRNRTYHHDGAFPTLVSAPDLGIAPRYVSV
jgi:GGDEF domain-containing protein